ncbi:MAG: quinoprotein dehydrogenase-associated SoxYZ-like carrier [Gammaproteobacteria bacterium]
MFKFVNKALIGSSLLLLLSQAAFCASDDEQVWNTTLKDQYFAGKTITESDDVIELEAPYRAEDPALVPLKIHAKLPQKKDRYIKKVIVLVDKNPFPFVGEFDFTPDSGRADLAMRVRVNTYSFVRAIAETNDGQWFMTKKFVKASGGCSAPIGADLDAAMQRLGKMKLKLPGDLKSGEPLQAQLFISHPNITGMQMDQVTRFIRKSHFVKQVRVTFNDKPVLTAKTDIAISADPNFRFYFMPEKSGELKAEFTDTSCETPTDRSVCSGGNTYSESFKVDL